MTDQSMQQALVDYCIALGDDSLVNGQRLSEWCAFGPTLEEDLALANVSLDYIGRAQMFYDLAAATEDNGRSADDIAFLRDARHYTNVQINELPRGDFAFTSVKQLMLDVFNVAFLQQMQQSSNKDLAAIADKAIKESRYHLRRDRDWVVRLGDGTEESNRRCQEALDELWGYTNELFVATDSEQQLIDAGIAVDRAALRDDWHAEIKAIFDEATLSIPDDQWTAKGGRDGIHTEHLGHMLSELQFLQRAYPGLEW